MTRTQRLILVLLVIGLVEAAVVIPMVLSPRVEEAIRNLGTDTVQAWAGDADETGILARYEQRAAGLITGLIRPLFAAPQADDPDPAFGGCLTCHQTYWEEPRFGGLYFDHPLHSKLDVECNQCHTDTSHPATPTPAMETCATCHDEVKTPQQCQLCHAPGDLSHYELMGVTRDGFRTCSQCHNSGVSAAPTGRQITDHGLFNGSESEQCASCHEINFCSNCHGSQHDNGWILDHAEVVQTDGSGSCLSCHASASCDACHSGDRTLRPLPVGWP